MPPSNIILFPTAERTVLEAGDTLDLELVGRSLLASPREEAQWTCLPEASLAGKVRLRTTGDKAILMSADACPEGDVKIQAIAGLGYIPFVANGYGLTISILDPDRELYLESPDSSEKITLLPGGSYIDIQAFLDEEFDKGLRLDRLTCFASLPDTNEAFQVPIECARLSDRYRVSFPTTGTTETIPLFGEDQITKYTTVSLWGPETKRVLRSRDVSVAEVKHGEHQCSMNCVHLIKTEDEGTQASIICLSPLAKTLDTSGMPDTTPWQVVLAYTPSVDSVESKITSGRRDIVLTFLYGEASISIPVRLDRSCRLLPLRRTAFLDEAGVLHGTDPTRKFWIRA